MFPEGVRTIAANPCFARRQAVATEEGGTDWSTINKAVAGLPSYVYFADEQDSVESLLFGGVFVHREKLVILDRGMADVKRAFGLTERDPVKWSPRQEEAYKPQRDLQSEQRTELRSKVLGLLDCLDATCFFAMVWKADKGNTAQAYMEAFKWVLQRLSITIERKVKARRALWYPALDVVVDWFPENDKSRDFFAIYDVAFHQGYTFPGKNVLRPLSEFSACPCLLATRCQFSPALQLTDFAVGAMGRLLRWSYKRDGEPENVASVVRPVVKHLLRGHGTVIGYGLVPPPTGACRKKLRAALKDLGLS